MTRLVFRIQEDLIPIYNLIHNIVLRNKKFILLVKEGISLYTIKKKGSISKLCRILSIKIITNSKGVKKCKISLNVSGPRRSCIIDLDEEKINNYLQETVLPFIKGYSS